MRVLDEAAERGVLFDATPSRPELVMLPSAEWERLYDLAALGRVVADALTDVTTLMGGERPNAPRIPWLSVLDDDDLRLFAQEFAAAARLAMETNRPEPVHEVLSAWKATAEYALSGRRLSEPIDWPAVVRITRPDDAPD